MRNYTFLVLGLLLSGPAFGQEAQDATAETSQAGAKAEAKPAEDLQDPLAILKRADAETKKVKLVKYEATFEMSGRDDDSGMKAKGNVVLGGEVKSPMAMPMHFKVQMEAAMPSGEKHELTVGADGTNYYLIDPQTKTAYVDIDPAVLGRMGNLARGLLVIEFIYPKPFEDEIKAFKTELRDSRKIGGEDCYQIYVMYQGQSFETTWFISKKDFLPRGVIRTTSKFQVMLDNLQADPELKEPFKLEIPEGYKKTDEPAS